MSPYIFVSYSRDDAQFVSPIVRLLRTAIVGTPSAAGEYWELVFLDVDNIQPGTEWKHEIDDAITRAAKMFVFWCGHASKSKEVQREYELALSLAKIVIPVRLDDTGLPELLSTINAVDLRELKTHGLQFRFAYPPPGQRRPHEVIVDRFASVFDIDPGIMRSKLFPSASGPPL